MAAVARCNTKLSMRLCDWWEFITWPVINLSEEAALQPSFIIAAAAAAGLAPFNAPRVRPRVRASESAFHALPFRSLARLKKFN